MSNNKLIDTTETMGFARQDKVAEAAIANCRGSTVCRKFIGPAFTINFASNRVHGVSDEKLKIYCRWRYA